jgi:hypothetical protein
MTITLKPDVTMDQFLDAVKNKWITEAEKHFDGWKGIIVKGNKGEHMIEYGLVWYIESMKAYNKFFNNDGSQTDEGKAVIEKLQPVEDELEKLGTWTSTYTDWVIQWGRDYMKHFEPPVMSWGHFYYFLV